MRPRAAPGPKCRHCAIRNVGRPRGLCWACYYTAGVLELYPASASRYARRPIDESAELPAPELPTTAAPGTAEKIAVMRARAADGRGVLHPADARWEGDPRPVEFMKRRAG